MNLFRLIFHTFLFLELLFGQDIKINGESCQYEEHNCIILSENDNIFISIGKFERMNSNLDVESDLCVINDLIDLNVLPTGNDTISRNSAKCVFEFIYSRNAVFREIIKSLTNGSYVFVYKISDKNKYESNISDILYDCDEIEKNCFSKRNKVINFHTCVK